MKIGYVLDDTLDKPDGVQQYVTVVGEYMRSLGHEVHYLVPETKRSDLGNIHSMGKFLSLRFNANTVRTPLPYSSRKIKQKLAELNLEILHVQLPFSPFFGQRIISNFNGPIVGTWHTFPADLVHNLSNRLLYWMIRPGLKKFSYTVAVSPATAEFVNSAYRTSADVVPNAVDIDRFSKAPASQTRSIVFLGRFVERKGPMLLVNAVSRLVRDGYKFNPKSIVMGGGGPDLEDCRRLSSELGVDGLIDFSGFVDEKDKPKLLASAKVAVFPSTGGEAFGISVVEAMASGQSIVLGGNNPGYASILSDRPELLFNPKNTRQFADKLRYYLDLDTKSRRALQLWLKTRAHDFDKTIVGKRLEEIYSTALSEYK